MMGHTQDETSSNESVESTTLEADHTHKTTYRLGRMVGTSTIAATTSFAVLVAQGNALSKFFPK
ncbi:hypothetical protein KJZ61_03765 [Candidatus Dependentiae bacterium]|nr:hypothetical protein [Candidatus Dependentiae bacterium]